MKVEFHCHSNFSGDSAAKVTNICKRAKQLGFSKVAITDHNTIRGSVELAAIAPEMAIISEEIQVQKDGKYLGELLGYFMNEEIPGNLELEEVLYRLKKQNAFISVAHPFDIRRSHFTQEILLKHCKDIDAYEVFNSRSMTKNANSAAARFVEENHLAGLNGSDAHSCYELGHSCVELADFHSADDLRRCLGEAVLESKISPKWVHLLSRGAVIQKRLWVKA